MDYDDLPVPEGTHVASMYFGSPNWTKGKNLDDLRYDALIRKLNSTESLLAFFDTKCHPKVVHAAIPKEDCNFDHIQVTGTRQGSSSFNVHL